MIIFNQDSDYLKEIQPIWLAFAASEINSHRLDSGYLPSGNLSFKTHTIS